MRQEMPAYRRVYLREKRAELRKMVPQSDDLGMVIAESVMIGALCVMAALAVGGAMLQ